MSFFKRLASMFSSSPKGRDHSLWFDVQCNRCGETIRARVDLWNDLSPDYDGDKQYYHCRKVIIGEGPCYQPIEVTLKFNDKHTLVEKRIMGGKFKEDEPA